MFTEKEIMNMSTEEFAKNWKEGKIQDAGLKLLGAREMTPEDEEHVKTHE